jgi:hypothetical protein
VWELNYRGEREFLQQASAQQAAARLTLCDGWELFLLGWTSVVERVFGQRLSEADVAKMGELAAQAAGRASNSVVLGGGSATGEKREAARVPSTVVAPTSPLPSELELEQRAGALGLSFAPLAGGPGWFGRVVVGAQLAKLEPPVRQLVVDALNRFGLLHFGSQRLQPAEQVCTVTPHWAPHTRTAMHTTVYRTRG